MLFTALSPQQSEVAEVTSPILATTAVLAAVCVPVVREQVIVEGKTFTILRPGQSDRLLDHPAVLSAFADDEIE